MSKIPAIHTPTAPWAKLAPEASQEMFQEFDEQKHDDTFMNPGPNFAEKNSLLKQRMMCYITQQCPNAHLALVAMAEVRMLFNGTKATVCLFSQNQGSGLPAKPEWAASTGIPALA